MSGHELDPDYPMDLGSEWSNLASRVPAGFKAPTDLIPIFGVIEDSIPKSAIDPQTFTENWDHGFGIAYPALDQRDIPASTLGAAVFR
jgi:hypothetical protein